MFGSDKYKKAKPKQFASDKERKQYFAIKAYYGKKDSQNNGKNKPKK